MKSLPGMTVPLPGRPLYLQDSPTPGSWPTYGLSMRFQVAIDDPTSNRLTDLGMWSACKGLKVTFATTTVKLGGNYAYEQVLPEQIKYSNVTLERGMLKNDSMKVQSWLAGVAKKWQDVDSYQGCSVTIKLYNATDDGYAMAWTLQHAYPVSWTGPSMVASESRIAIETLEFAHQGFLSVSSP